MKRQSLITRKSILPVLFALSILIVVSLACNIPVLALKSSGTDENIQATNQVATDIVKSLTAMALDQQRQADGESELERTSEVIKETGTPSITPSVTPSPTATYTPTVGVPAAFISENTNCRFGPGEVYDLIHTFMAGESVDLIGKNLAETFWFVQDQEGGMIKCWLWGNYATPEGNTADLVVFTPAPTPTPVIDFTIQFKDTFCGDKEIIVKINNTGELTLESFTATFKDKATSETTTKSANQFNAGVVKIPVGKTAELTSGTFSVSTINHKIVATIKICSDDSQQGKCVTRTVEFKSK